MGSSGGIVREEFPRKSTMAVSLNSCSTSWSSKFHRPLSDFSGFVRSIDEASDLIKEYEVSTTSTFVEISQTKAFGNTVTGEYSI